MSLPGASRRNVSVTIECASRHQMKKEEFLEALNGGPWAEILNTRLRSAESSAARADAHMKKMWPPQGAM